MSSKADRNLSQSARDKIEHITNEAKRTGNWSAANKAANEVRSSEGAHYSVDRHGKTSYDNGDTISSDRSGSHVHRSGLSGGYDDAGYTPTPKVERREPVYRQRVPDMNDYIAEMNRAQIKAKIAEMRSAYQQNVNTLQDTRNDIAPAYQTARNKQAAQSAQERQRFNEYAAAAGINTGASSQAGLANNIALQNQMAGLQKSETEARGDVDLQRSQLETAYNNAIAQAEASGDAATAQQLYQEFVRQTENAQAQSNWQEQLNFQKQQATAQQDARDRDYNYRLATSMINSGRMPDTMTLQNAGISAADAQSMVQAVQQAQAAAQTQATASNRHYSSSPSPAPSGTAQPDISDPTPLAERIVPEQRNWVMVPGFGRVLWDELERLVDSGQVIEIPKSDGSYFYRKA